MKAKEVLHLLGITRQTLYNYLKQGKIKLKTKYNKTFYEYDDDSVYQLIGNINQKSNRKIISYSRVSTQNQKEQLKEQTQRIYNSCISRNIKLDEQFEDIKSGMNHDRPKFQELIRLVIGGRVQLIVVENKDRLVRFGFETLEQIFKYFGTRILVLNDSLENKTYEQELTEDLISIIHYFTMKSYSHRRKLNKLQKDIENKVIRTVGDPVERFTEDGLRILRAIRFRFKLGFTFDAATYKAIRSNWQLLEHISQERITSEFLQIIDYCTINSQQDTLLVDDLIYYLLPAAWYKNDYDNNFWRYEAIDRFSDTECKLAYLLRETNSSPETVCKKLKLSKTCT